LVVVQTSSFLRYRGNTPHDDMSTFHDDMSSLESIYYFDIGIKDTFNIETIVISMLLM